MQFEILFFGPPEYCLEMVEIYSTFRLHERDPFIWKVKLEHNFIQLWDVTKDESTYASIKVQHGPDNQSILIVYIPDNKLADLSEWWDLLYNKMIEQGWVASKSNGPPATIKQPEHKNNEISAKDKSYIPKKQGKPNQQTLDKINRLANHREEQIKKMNIVPGWITSCRTIGIDPKTVIRYAPELRSHWDDKSFHWDF